MMRRFGAMAAAAVILAGCSGVDPDKLSQFRSGKTSVAEVISALGRPDRDEALPDGSRMLMYLNQRSGTKLVNFIPGPAHIWGGWNVKTGEAGLMFGPDGILRFHSWSADDQTHMRAVGRAISPHADKPQDADKPQEN